MELYIGNKNYSSWSMRPWLVLEHFKIEYEEHLIFFDDFKEDNNFKKEIKKVSPAGKVPTLVSDGYSIWDSLAICEYLADQFPELNLWPKEVSQRARARSISAEMHSGFSSLRSHCGMNIDGQFSEIGQKLWSQEVTLRNDVERIETIWSGRPKPQGFLCGDEFTIADAFFAPVIMRFESFQLPISESSKQYMQTMMQLPAIQKWIAEAKKEKKYVPREELYRKQLSK